MPTTLSGSCMCNKIKFTVEDDFSTFHLCHCKQCQQLTGSAFASNLFTRPDNIRWLSGESLVKTFVHDSRDFSNAFCSECGSTLPFITKSGKALIVPAGSLDQKPSLDVRSNIFCVEKAHWLHSLLDAKTFEGFPEKENE